MEIPLRITDNRTKPNLQKLLFGLFCQVLSTSGTHQTDDSFRPFSVGPDSMPAFARMTSR